MEVMGIMDSVGQMIVKTLRETASTGSGTSEMDKKIVVLIYTLMAMAVSMITEAAVIEIESSIPTDIVEPMMGFSDKGVARMGTIIAFVGANCRSTKDVMVLLGQMFVYDETKGIGSNTGMSYGRDMSKENEMHVELECKIINENTIMKAKRRANELWDMKNAAGGIREQDEKEEKIVDTSAVGKREEEDGKRASLEAATETASPSEAISSSIKTSYISEPQEVKSKQVIELADIEAEEARIDEEIQRRLKEEEQRLKEGQEQKEKQENVTKTKVEPVKIKPPKPIEKEVLLTFATQEIEW
jgi:hypothetical protein